MRALLLEVTTVEVPRERNWPLAPSDGKTVVAVGRLLPDRFVPIPRPATLRVRGDPKSGKGFLIQSTPRVRSWRRTEASARGREIYARRSTSGSRGESSFPSASPLSKLDIGYGLGFLWSSAVAVKRLSEEVDRGGLICARSVRRSSRAICASSACRPRRPIRSMRRPIGARCGPKPARRTPPICIRPKVTGA